VSPGPVELLRLLASTGHAGGRGPSPAAEPGGANGFAALLARAERGEVSSGLPVTIARGAGVELTLDQLSRLAAAADRAEARGATRALVLIDGLALRLDVGVRQVTGVADLGSGDVLTGIDAVIRVPSPEPPGGAVAPVPLPRADAAAMNPSLARVLADRRDRTPGGE
jgi:hypothetical protein